MGNEQSRERKPILMQKAIAIDFGTANSGFAYAENSMSEIKLNPAWDGKKLLRTPSNLLLDQDQELVDFGYKVKSGYYEKKVKGTLLENIKLQILGIGQHKNPGVFAIESVFGERVSAVMAFAAALQYMKNAYKKTVGTDVHDSEVVWVITIPSNWQNKHRDFMHLSAYSAKLWHNASNTNFIIVTEAAASLHFCKNLKPSDFANSEDAKNHTKVDNVMVIDAGGGTVDIAVSIKNQLEKGETEKHWSTAGRLGGHTINEEFERYLCRHVPFFQDFPHYSEEHSLIWLKFMDAFEKAKRDFSGGNDVNMVFDAKFMNEFKSTTGKHLYEIDFGENIEILFTEGNYLTRGECSLTIMYERMKKIFDKTVNGILKKIEETLEESNAEVKQMYLVGGFGQHKYLQQQLKRFTHQHCIKLLIPKEASVCVMKGALQFAYSRRSEFNHEPKVTYSYVQAVEFDRQNPLHRNRPRLPKNASKVLTLNHLAKKGKVVKLGEFFEELVDPYEKNNDYIIEIYISEKEVVEGRHPSEAEWLCTFTDCDPNKRYILSISFTKEDVRIALEEADGSETVVRRVKHSEIEKPGCTIQ